MAPQKLSSEQLALLAQITRDRAPHLHHLVERLSGNSTISDLEADELEDVLADVMLGDEYSHDDGLTGRGTAIDDLIGLCRRHAESFFASEG